jgi:DNA-cytosine methyltransferase
MTEYTQLEFIDKPVYQHQPYSMKYMSLFSGIGGFEVAIHRMFPKSKCLGYSEIKPSAIKVYQHHYPDHRNLGDITQITDKEIHELTKDGCDLIVGGFPCTNLSSLASLNGSPSGLEGPNSGLLYEMIRVVRVAKPKYFIAENNYSMKKSNRKLITKLFQEVSPEVHMTMLDAADFGVQTRKRLFWTNFPIKDCQKVCTQTWDDVLEPLENVRESSVDDAVVQMMNKPFRKSRKLTKTRVAVLNKNGFYDFVSVELNSETRWDDSRCSDTMKEQLYTYPVGKSRPVTASHMSSPGNIIIDRRHDTIIIRKLELNEQEKLMRFETGYTRVIPFPSVRANLLGNAVVPTVVVYIIASL